MNRHNYFVRALVLLPLLAVVSCESPTAPRQPLPVTRILNGVFSHTDAPQRLVLRSQREFDDAWAAMFANVLMMPTPMMAIDFSQEMVIIVNAGPKPTTGFCIGVAAAAGDRRSMEVTVRQSGPTPNMGVAPVITHPFDVVRVPRRDSVTFADESINGSCVPVN